MRYAPLVLLWVVGALLWWLLPDWQWWVAVGLIGFSPGCACCEAVNSGPCDACVDGIQPLEIEMTLDNLVEAGCGHCAELLGPFILPRFGGCNYKLDLGPLCLVTRIVVQVGLSQIDIQFSDFPFANIYLEFRDTTPDLDCMNWSSYVIPLISLGPLSCNNVGTPHAIISAL